MKTKIVKLLITYCILLTVFSALGTILLMLVSLIPQDFLVENTNRSSEVLLKEGTYYQIWSGDRSSRLDNFTDALILSTSFYTEEDITKEALLATNIRYKGRNPVESLNDYFSNEEGFYTSLYARYWHGYQIIIKPLLMVFDISTIRAINAVLQFSLVIALLCTLSKNGKGLLCIPLFAVWMCLSPISISFSLQFSPVFYATFVSSYIISANYKRFSMKDTGILFFIVGISVAYFDLLTFPIVSLGIPLILYLSLKHDIYKESSSPIIETAFYSCSWLVGYAGMWALKWIITAILTDTNILSEVFNSISIRTSHQYKDNYYTVEDVLINNLRVMSTNWRMFLLLVIILMFVVLLFHNKFKRIAFSMYMSIGVVIIYPLLWFSVLVNHSYVHSWMTYRVLCVSIYGILSLMFLLINDQIS